MGLRRASSASSIGVRRQEPVMRTSMEGLAHIGVGELLRMSQGGRLARTVTGPRCGRWVAQPGPGWQQDEGGHNPHNMNVRLRVAFRHPARSCYGGAPAYVLPPVPRSTVE
jgi:hypothetical protein